MLRADAEDREDFVELIELCRRTLEIDRHHEETYRALMTAHGRRGELACVRRWYELCARRMRDELAVAPGHETQRLLRTLIPAAARAAAPAQAPASVGGAPATVRALRPAGRQPGTPAWSAEVRNPAPPRPVRRARPDNRPPAALARTADPATA